MDRRATLHESDDCEPAHTHVTSAEPHPKELAKARFVVDVQTKLHALLETISEGADTEPRSTP